ncbi:hypothetical protein L2E82_35799 [Cichorium intybus]|uniref:Uncharacterized protein n=1 Tax=Cichorium intybus TaxID=13427 RepID=A0ACB9BPU6_CICIN|nr:hypothetical protein L2E82_35799 [Cichorium intybus]
MTSVDCVELPYAVDDVTMALPEKVGVYVKTLEVGFHLLFSAFICAYISRNEFFIDDEGCGSRFYVVEDGDRRDIPFVEVLGVDHGDQLKQDEDDDVTMMQQGENTNHVYLPSMLIDEFVDSNTFILSTHDVGHC